eukprot:755218-Amorphochlora_amoeboformis.AAC.1
MIACMLAAIVTRLSMGNSLGILNKEGLQKLESTSLLLTRVERMGDRVALGGGSIPEGYGRSGKGKGVE